MYRMRLWSVSKSRLMEACYDRFEHALVKVAPILGAFGFERFERPVAALEKVLKGVLFDCKMCGQCVLGSTGMSCPMNCPKTLRNGPCGGVRADGNCEVKPQMRCVWVEAARGAARMRRDGLHTVQFAVDMRLKGRSSWLQVARGHSDAQPEKIVGPST